MKVQTYWDGFLDEIGDEVKDLSPRQLLWKFYLWLNDHDALKANRITMPIEKRSRGRHGTMGKRG